jgi:NitT/TauT family transport system substrate-binding protein
MGSAVSLPLVSSRCNTPNRRQVVRLLAASPLAGLTARFSTAHAADGLAKLALIVGTSPPDPACHFLYYARDMDFYRNAGLDVEISGITSATNATRAVVAGQADIGWVDGTSSLQARAAGARIQAISGFAHRLDYVIVGDKDIGSLKQLEGKRFAVATLGGGTYIIPRLMMEQAGADPDRAQWVAIGNSAARAQAMIAGTVDATITTSSFVPRLLGYPKYHVIAEAGKELPHMAYTWEIAGERAFQQKQPALRAFVAATAQAVQWAGAHPDEAVALSVGLLPDADKSEIVAGIRSYIANGFWSRDGALPREVVDFTVAALRKAGQLHKDVAYADFVRPDMAAP